MPNRVREAALQVFREAAKEYELQVKQNGPDSSAAFVLTIKKKSGDIRYGFKPTDPVVDEIRSALRVLNPDVTMILTEIECFIHCDARYKDEHINLKRRPITDQPVGSVATQLADAGIEFEGSARFKTPTVESAPSTFRR
jgi:hypothetical protein